jgi:hypothetical protein
MTMQEGRKPVLIVVAGANGSSKTTLTNQLLSDRWLRGVTYLNPDAIAEERIGGWNDPKAVLQAAQYVTEEREAALAPRRRRQPGPRVRTTAARSGGDAARRGDDAAALRPRQPGLTATTPTQSYLMRGGAQSVRNSKRHDRADELRTAGPAPPSWSKMRCSMAM